MVAIACATTADAHRALWLRWLGWNIAALGPPLYGSSGVAIDALAFGLLAYAAGRLIDDGFDNHESYKGRHPSLVGTLRGRIAGAPTYRACVQSVFVGFSLFHYALRRMRQADHCDWADQVSRLFDALSVGVVAEGLLVAPVGVDVYHQVIRRKSVAYNLILYKTFLAPLKPALRGELLRTLAEMDELAQLVNDYVDLNEDVLAGTLNALTFGVYHRVDLESVILSKATAAWMATESLNESVRDAMAVMIRSVLSPYRERVVSNAV